MSTLGFGDITFQSDLGRAFSVLVLMTGIVMLLIVLPFAFIRFFYAPWLETQIQNRAPRKLPPDTQDHIIICAYDSLASGLVEWCEREQIPYVVIEPDASKASEWHLDGISVVVGDRDNQQTYENINVNQAQMVVANCEDVLNTNITLTVREVSEDVPIIALSSDPNAVDILELSGATNVLSLKRRLGQQLVNRVMTQWTGSYSIGEYNDLKVAELPVHNTSLAGKSIGETKLRNETGVNIIGVSDQGPIEPPLPDKQLTETSVLLVLGTEAQLDIVKSFLSTSPAEEAHLLLIGGGTVGRAAASVMKSRGISFIYSKRNRADVENFGRNMKMFSRGMHPTMRR
jgi:Trk K+ transport system NAD-binding subunit